MDESIYVCFKAFKAIYRSIRASRVAVDADGSVEDLSLVKLSGSGQTLWLWSNSGVARRPPPHSAVEDCLPAIYTHPFIRRNPCLGGYPLNRRVVGESETI